LAARSYLVALCCQGVVLRRTFWSDNSKKTYAGVFRPIFEKSDLALQRTF